MARMFPHLAMALGFLVAPLAVLAQPAPAEAPAVQTADAPPAAAPAEASERKRRIAVQRARRLPGGAEAEQHYEQMAAMTDEQLEAHAQELIQEAGKAEIKRWQAEMAEKSLVDAYRQAPDEEKPELYVLRVESTAKARVLRNESQSLRQKAINATAECSRRYAEKLGDLPVDQLRVQLRNLVRKHAIALRQCQTLKSAPPDDRGAAAGASRSAELEMSWLERQLRDVENAYTERLMESDK